MPVCLHMVFGYFAATMAETVTHRAFWPFTENVLIPA